MRKRLGNFVIAEDEQTMEGVILAKLREAGHTLAVAETFTGGNIAARIAPLVGAETVFKRGVVTRDGAVPAEALRKESDASLALSVGVQLDEGPDRPGLRRQHLGRHRRRAGQRRPPGPAGRRPRLGARGRGRAGLDCLRRHLLGLPVDERIDFERR